MAYAEESSKAESFSTIIVDCSIYICILVAVIRSIYFLDRENAMTDDWVHLPNPDTVHLLSLLPSRCLLAEAQIFFFSRGVRACFLPLVKGQRLSVVFRLPVCAVLVRTGN